MKRNRLLIVLAVVAVMFGTVVASFPNAAADATSSILSMVKSIQTTVQSIQTIVQSTQATVQNTNNNLNKVKVETVISGPPITIGVYEPGFLITANQPWDLLAVYITTNGVGTNDELAFGITDLVQENILRLG